MIIIQFIPLDEVAIITFAAGEATTTPRLRCRTITALRTNPYSKTALSTSNVRPGRIAGRVVQTCGIEALPIADQSAIREKVEAFSDFTPDNDPYGEHDFGAFDYNGERVFWKIDYYNRTLTQGSEDPRDPTRTVRVLTIMLASEY